MSNFSQKYFNRYSNKMNREAKVAAWHFAKLETTKINTKNYNFQIPLYRIFASILMNSETFLKILIGERVQKKILSCESSLEHDLISAYIKKKKIKIQLKKKNSKVIINYFKISILRLLNFMIIFFKITNANFTNTVWLEDQSQLKNYKEIFKNKIKFEKLSFEIIKRNLKFSFSQREKNSIQNISSDYFEVSKMLFKYNIFSKLFRSYKTKNFFFLEGDSVNQDLIYLLISNKTKIFCFQWGCEILRELKPTFNKISCHMFLSWSEYWLKVFERYNICKFMVIGNPTLKIKKKKIKKPKTIGALMLRETNSDDEIINSDIIDILLKYNNHKVILRNHPLSFNEKYRDKAQLFDFHNAREVKFEKTLNTCDFFILNFSSTIIEILNNNSIPIVYNPTKEKINIEIEKVLNHKNLKLICNTKNELDQMVKKILSSEKFQSDLKKSITAKFYQNKKLFLKKNIKLTKLYKMI